MFQPPAPKINKDVIAVVCSDAHVSHDAPVFRSAEPDWYKAQERPWMQIKGLTQQYKVPLLFAGDLFHKWNSPAESINWIWRMLPDTIYAVYGQHDIPFQRPSDINKSAFGVLVESGRINLLRENQPVPIHGAVLYGFPWGAELRPCVDGNIDPFGIRVAVCHKYVWKTNCSFPNAPAANRVGRLAKSLAGFDVTFFGDNHRKFIWKTIVNCGGLLRRNSDELNHQPAVYLLHADAGVTEVLLDCSQDVYLRGDGSDLTESSTDFSQFVQELEDLEGAVPDFIQEVKQSLVRLLDDKKITLEVNQVVLKLLEK